MGKGGGPERLQSGEGLACQARAELDAFLASSHETVSCGGLSPEGQAVRDFRRLEARKQKSRKVSLGVPASIETTASGTDRCPVCT